MKKLTTGNYESRAALELAVLTNIDAGFSMKSIAEHSGVSTNVVFMIKHPDRKESHKKYKVEYYQENKEVIAERKRDKAAALAEHKRVTKGAIVNAMNPYNASRPTLVTEDIAVIERREAFDRRHRKENFIDIRERASTAIRVSS